MCFRHVSYPAASVSPPSTWAKGQSAPNSLKCLLSFLQTCKKKKKKKKDTKHLALWGKWLWRKFSHIFLYLHKFSVLHSSRVVWEFELKFGFFIGLGIQARLPTFVWLLALVHYRHNVSMKHCFKYYTFPIWRVNLLKGKAYSLYLFVFFSFYLQSIHVSIASI